MPVVLSPSSQLTFSEPQDPRGLVARPEILVLNNIGSAPVAFKVKTTAPDQYSVRPNAGKVEPNSRLTLQVYLQPVQTDIKERSKDRFLIQAVEMTPDEVEALDITQMWQRIEAKEKERMDMFRLRCVFSPDLAKDKAATSTMAEKKVPSPPRVPEAESTPPASPKQSSHNNNDVSSSLSSSPDLALHEAVAVHEENVRLLKAEVIKNKTTIAQLQEELTRTHTRLEDSERRCEQFKTSLVDKYGARHVQLFMEQQEHEHSILVVWVAITLTFVALRLVI